MHDDDGAKFDSGLVILGFIAGGIFGFAATAHLQTTLISAFTGAGLGYLAARILRLTAALIYGAVTLLGLLAIFLVRLDSFFPPDINMPSLGGGEPGAGVTSTFTIVRVPTNYGWTLIEWHCDRESSPALTEACHIELSTDNMRVDKIEDICEEFTDQVEIERCIMKAIETIRSDQSSAFDPVDPDTLNRALAFTAPERKSGAGKPEQGPESITPAIR